MKLKTVKEINLRNKRVLLRVDYNVSVDHQQKLGNDLRIRKSLKTIEYLLKRNCRVVIISHLGKPGGRVNQKWSLKPVKSKLELFLGKRVSFLDEKIGSAELKQKLDRCLGVCLLENLRFYKGERENSKEFVNKLSELADVYVLDAFGACHREHASIVGVTKHMESAAGLLLAEEVKVILKAIEKPKRPLVMIVGGAKIKTKIKSVDEMLDKADDLVFGGGVGSTLLEAQGFNMNKSLVEKEIIGEMRRWLKKAGKSKTKIWLPEDIVYGNLKSRRYGGIAMVGEEFKGQVMDIGPKTEVVFGKVIEKAGTIIWNGPVGVHEHKLFRRGTDFVFEAIAKNRESMSIVGGGDTLTALNNKDYLEAIDLVSTGGGAMLQLIEQRTLPGLKRLMKK